MFDAESSTRVTSGDVRMVRSHSGSRGATTLLVLGLLLGACEQGQGGDAGRPVQDARALDHSFPFDVSPQPDVSWPRTDAATGCDGLGPLGRCDDGAVLRWCEQGQSMRVDCAAEHRSCGAHPELDPGVWCLGGEDASCAHWPCAPSLRCDGRQRCGPGDGGVRDVVGEDS